jgi:hypothetical protein
LEGYELKFSVEVTFFNLLLTKANFES